ncbi:hypothetical protein [Streptomyces sp. NRRL F-5193]|uniref:hypothetical protein n=1 Tax=Streptomyces sp. NRRL F-5193 TaxID=1463860 RepID=UPI00068A826E|nr:hypothetical protein [Streptomyces sp. NRRL F-5193]
MSASAHRVGLARGELASFLRTHLRQGGWDWHHIAERTGLSVSTLRRTCCTTGPVPREENVVAFTEAVTSGHARSVAEARQLWRRARIEHRGILPGLRAPAVRYIRTEADLLAALAAAYERAGAPPLRTLQNHAGRAGTVPLLALNTAARIIKRTHLPTSVMPFEAFLTGCGVGQRDRGPWLEAWVRVREQPVITPPPRTAPFSPVPVLPAVAFPLDARGRESIEQILRGLHPADRQHLLDALRDHTPGGSPVEAG